MERGPANLRIIARNIESELKHTHGFPKMIVQQHYSAYVSIPLPSLESEP
jgi:hypothetical protein